MPRKTLYHPVIIEHNQHPHHTGIINDATHSAEGYNKICGDFIKVYLKIKGNIIIDFKFTPECCAICRASGSIMGDMIITKNITDFTSIKDQFLHFLKGEQMAPALDALTVFALLKDFPARIKCASLPFQTVQAAINNTKEATSEDD